MRRRVRAAASLCFFSAAQARKLYHSQGVSCARRELFKTPPAEQRRRCSHRNLERVYPLVFLVDRAVRPFELVAKIGLATAMTFVEAPPPGHAVLSL